MPELPNQVEDPRSLMVAGAVVAVAVALFLIQEWLLRRAQRSLDPLVDPGRATRRRAASLLMLATGLTMAVGSTIGPKVGGRPNLAFVAVWMLVLAEVAGLLALAWFDLGATRRIARTLREDLQRQNLADIAALQRRREADRPEAEGTNGHPH